MRPAMPPRPNSGQSVEMPQVQCCRCKGYRSPGNCPHFNPAPSNQSSVQHRPPSNKRSFQPLKSGGPPHQTTTPSSNTVCNRVIFDLEREHHHWFLYPKSANYCTATIGGTH